MVCLKFMQCCITTEGLLFEYYLKTILLKDERMQIYAKHPNDIEVKLVVFAIT